MAKAKFCTWPTNEGMKTVNINNIALIEKFDSGTYVTMNIVRDEKNITYIVNLPWPDVASEVEMLSKSE